MLSEAYSHTVLDVVLQGGTSPAVQSSTDMPDVDLDAIIAQGSFDQASTGAEGRLQFFVVA